MATDYIVLVRDGEGPNFAVAGTAEAYSAEQAVTLVAQEFDGTFVAVPARNWTQIERGKEQPPPVLTNRETGFDGDGLPHVKAPPRVPRPGQAKLGEGEEE